MLVCSVSPSILSANFAKLGEQVIVLLNGVNSFFLPIVALLRAAR